MDSRILKAGQQILSGNLSDDVKVFLLKVIDNSDEQEKQHNEFSKPMPWIGMYIALASLFCILAMVADLIHGILNKKLWFPCKYFTLNAASLAVITVAMKLPVDLSNPMSRDMDQTAKIVSLAFMCTMMANLMPSIATMDNMELLTNIIALGVLVITLIVNVCIQIHTGVVTPDYYGSIFLRLLYGYQIKARIYMAMLLLLLIIQTCSALTILKSKQILESKYQTAHETTLQQSGRLTFEKLKQHVTKHGIMAGTGSPQFIMACSTTTSASGIETKFSAPVIVLEGNSERQRNNGDRRRYVLQLQDDIEVADRTLDSITKYVNRVIHKAKKQQPNHLIKLLRNYKDFEGVRRYANYLVQTLPAEEYCDSWSLPLVTLTTIAISLTDFQEDKVDMLLSSVNEGLAYVTHVEESLNATHEYASSQKAARLLWIEVEFSQKWLGNKLKNTIYKPNTTRRILEWFRDIAKNIVTEMVGMDIEVSNEKLVSRSLCAYSMYCITESLLRSYQDDINTVTQQSLFEELLLMIADIFASCLTNLQQVIVVKCHTNVIEKREACVHDAAQLLGKTIQIINSFRYRKIPSMNEDELAFFDKWCAYFNQSIP